MVALKLVQFYLQGKSTFTWRCDFRKRTFFTVTEQRTLRLI
jgi:hypothetical protein